MLTPLADTFGRRLRGLEEATLRRFVAALWRASGWEVSVEGERVVATRPGGDTSQVILVRTGWLRPFALRGPVEEADVLVTGLGARARQRLASRLDIHVLGAADLRERLRYAVDEADRDRLLRTHLGTTPAVLDRDRPHLVPVPSGVPGSIDVWMVVVALLVLSVTAGATLDTTPGGAIGEHGAEETPVATTTAGRKTETSSADRREERPIGFESDCRGTPRETVRYRLAQVADITVHELYETAPQVSVATTPVGVGPPPEVIRQLRTVAYRPLLDGRNVSVVGERRAEHDRSVVRVRATNRSGSRVAYEFVLLPNEYVIETGHLDGVGGCWVIAEIRMAAGRPTE
jgi:hypothetical protein